MYYQVMSFSHKNCDLALREKLAFANDAEIKEMLDQLVSFDYISEVFIISTCNRVEIIMATSDNFSSYHTVLGLMSQKSRQNFYDIKNAVKTYDDEEAISHIFSVVSSLDSLVVGESQITGQVKEAFKLSLDHGTAGEKMNRVIAYATKCAAAVRNATNISQSPISIASVAVAQAHNLLGEHIQGMTGVVVGAGEMAVLAAKHLLRVGCDVVFVGRNLEKVQKVADSLGENVKAETMDKLPKYINRYKLLFSATSSPEPVITNDLIENRTIPRFWFDMAIPRDIEEMDLEKLKLFRIDDLREISKSNHSLREEKALEAAAIVDQYKEEFYAWLRALSIEPVIREMRSQVSNAIEKELLRAIHKRFVPAEYEANMRKMAEQMFNRFLHDPTQNLRHSSADKKNINSIETIQKMFDIEIDRCALTKYKEDHHIKGYES
ncbi:MAG: glutamyl-tRNA reductase [Sulfurimonas sp.]